MLHVRQPNGATLQDCPCPFQPRGDRRCPNRVHVLANPTGPGANAPPPPRAPLHVPLPLRDGVAAPRIAGSAFKGSAAAGAASARKMIVNPDMTLLVSVQSTPDAESGARMSALSRRMTAVVTA